MSVQQYSIKNQQQIIAESTNNFDGKDFELAVGTKLSEVLDFLPYGRINKTETGIGATTCELVAKRNSIIVQPLKITAKEKAKTGKYLYYESSSPLDFDSGIPEDLSNYLEDNTIVHKKIIVVADSLRNLYLHLINYPATYVDYFLLIDEIDSIQKDSSFRSKMEDCIEVYKSHHFEHRGMVTATMMDFADDELTDVKKSPLTKFYYPTHAKSQIDFIEAIQPRDTLVVEISKLITSRSYSGKLVIAFNNVSECVKIANTLVESHNVTKQDVSILCGINEDNKKRTNGYNIELTASDKLPSTINFKTAAYFNGFDINEVYDLIIIADAAHPSTRLSENTMVQIMGRCRVGLNSTTIIFKGFHPDRVPKVYQLNDLIATAQDEIDSLNCLEKHYKKNILLRDKLKDMRALLYNVSGINGFNFVKGISKIRTVKPYRIEEKNAIAYLGIDSCMEDNRVASTLYNQASNMIDAFRNLGYNVSNTSANHTKKVSKTKVLTKKTLWMEFVDELINQKPTKEQLKAKMHIEKDNQKKNALTFIVDGVNRGITITSMLDVVKKCNSFDDKLLYTALEYFLEKERVPESEKPYKHMIQSLFKKDESYTSLQILEKYFNLKNISLLGDLLNQKATESNAKAFFSNFVGFTPKRISINNKQISKWKVDNFNPYGFKSNKK
jgi:hypothetical protein